jgi:hypothetical protein
MPQIPRRCRNRHLDARRFMTRSQSARAAVKVGIKVIRSARDHRPKRRLAAAGKIATGIGTSLAICRGWSTANGEREPFSAFKNDLRTAWARSRDDVWLQVLVFLLVIALLLVFFPRWS